MKVSTAQYHAFSTPLEGRVPSMYVDVKGLITCGVGNLIDPIVLAESIPWTLADGTPADLAQVRADWHLLKDGAARYSKLHWRFAQAATKCRLTDAAIDALIDRQVAANEAALRKRFPAWDSFPADAQLAIMSIAWAVGAGFYRTFTNLANCIDAQDWEGCVAACKIREEGNPGVVPRNAKNRFCFHNAALVKTHGLDTEQLCWPNVAPVGFPGEPSEQSKAAHAAADEAQVQEAAWHALETCPYEPTGSGQALREYEGDTDRAPPPGEHDA